MKSIFFFVLLSSLSLGALAAPNAKTPTFTLQDAIAKKMIVLSQVKRVQKQSLQLTIKNILKHKDIKIYFPTGLQFASKDSSEQDQITLQERLLLVQAGKTIHPSLRSYCTQSNHISPALGSGFSLKPVANGKLLELASFLAKVPDSEYTAQHAIWSITNNHDLKGLYHKDFKTALKIQQFVAKLTGKALPKYTVQYKDGSERQVAFTGESIKIHGHHEYTLEKDVVATCQLFDEAGTMVQEVFKAMPQRKGKIRFNFHLKTMDLPKGKYVSRVFVGGKVFQEEWIEA